MTGTLVVKVAVNPPSDSNSGRSRLVTVYSQQCEYAEAQELLDAFWDANPWARRGGPVTFEMGAVHL